MFTKCTLWPGRGARLARWLPVLFCVGLVELAFFSTPGRCVQDEVAMDEDDGQGAAASAIQTKILWCGLADGAAKRFYVSDLFVTDGSSHLVLWAYDSRFARALNGRFMTGFRTGTNACHASGTRGEALAARALALRDMATARYDAVHLSVF